MLNAEGLMLNADGVLLKAFCFTFHAFQSAFILHVAFNY